MNSQQTSTNSKRYCIQKNQFKILVLQDLNFSADIIAFEYSYLVDLFYIFLKFNFRSNPYPCFLFSGAKTFLVGCAQTFLVGCAQTFLVRAQTFLVECAQTFLVGMCPDLSSWDVTRPF